MLINMLNFVVTMYENVLHSVGMKMVNKVK